MTYSDAVDGVEPVMRAAVSGVEGYSADTDDELGRLELVEEDINPAQQAKQRDGGGRGGMMPPMVGGPGTSASPGVSGGLGARGGVGVNASTAPGGLPVVGAGGGPGASASAGSGVSGVTGGLGSGSAGSVPSVGGGSAGVGHPGFGVGSGTVAAGSSGADAGFGINPVTGRAWSPSDPGFSERFGSYDPKTGLWVNPATGMAYDPRTGRWSHVGGSSFGGGPTGAGARAGVAGAGMSPVVSGGGAVSPGAGSAGAGVGSGGVSGVSVSGAGGVPSAGSSSGLGTTRSSGMGAWQSSSGDLRTASAHWDGLSAEMEAVKSAMNSTKTPGFGVVNHPRTAFWSSSAKATKEASDTTGRYAGTSSNLSGSASGYEEVEAVNAAVAERGR
ncbi:hypothetical protein HMPREF1531_01428 [Propionibacterium sp. oral taxon 192 str. F0372]|uniref:hypothetical protein n=1 Tax=Propionibacterium sp. oral taxon 192 TaxID=671222 RepID=UPI0003544DAF|nr:hypothetical protein [Propionibacterium sp. oral taxon 192]EPH03369.1 hypothetical protein HMPREF1531_01428 [Propionibacterium sp. oral taxon 192 str. F0372]